jgi:kinesin family protein 4/21/27
MFDKVFPQSITQESLFTELQIPLLIEKVLDGYSATVFAYGLTGSGKTYTMGGPEHKATQNSESGIIPRSIKDIFEQIDKMPNKEVSKIRIYCSYMQIYNEKIYDLLNLKKEISQGLRLRWTKEEQFQVENLFVFEVKNAEEAFGLFQYGNNNRAVASHSLNLTSSRSHALFTLTVERVSMDENITTTVSKLQLVDLAGSERSSYGQNKAEQHVKESVEINKSLFILRKVIALLGDKNGVVPYRESKLTCLLKHSLGGHTYCLMVK